MGVQAGVNYSLPFDGVGAAAGGCAECLQLGVPGPYPGGARGAVPVHVALGAAVIPAGPLLCGRQVVWSTRGVQQGDPLGPFLFATALRRALANLPAGG